jgi:hypothetical protein
MKKVIDSKKLLFENMEKLNPEFKIKEEEDKWIQGAVNPEHKGYCTPMTKSTCTPKRKALAQRFKKGIDETFNINDYGENSEVFKQMTDEIKHSIDELYAEGDYEIIHNLYTLMGLKKNNTSIGQKTV